MQWYYGVNNAQFGPVAEAEILSKLRSGELRGGDMVWREGMADWGQVALVPEFAAAVSSVAVPASSPGAVEASPYAPPLVPGGAFPVVPVQSTSGLAIGALVMGILGILLCQLLSVGGVICGHMALNEIRRAEGRMGGRGMAIAGLVIGYFGLAILGLALLVFLFGALGSSSARF